MSILVEKPLKPGRSFTPSEALAKSVGFTDEMMQVAFTDGRILSVPLIWFPVLHQATPDQLRQVEILAGGRGLSWPELDEDLSIAGLLAGVDWKAA